MERGEGRREIRRAGFREMRVAGADAIDSYPQCSSGDPLQPLSKEWHALAMLSPGSLWLFCKKRKDSKCGSSRPVRRPLK